MMARRPLEEQIRIREHLRTDRLNRWYADAREVIDQGPETSFEDLAAKMLRRWQRDLITTDGARLPEAYQVIAAAFQSALDRQNTIGPSYPLPTDEVPAALHAGEPLGIGPAETCAWCLLTMLLTAGVVSSPVLGAKYYWSALLSGWGIISAFIFLRVRQ